MVWNVLYLDENTFESLFLKALSVLSQILWSVDKNSEQKSREIFLHRWT